MSRNNNNISDETLLGYLLMALSHDEQEHIDQLAALDPILNQRIQDLRGLLDPLKQSEEHFEPRADLSSSTMKFIHDAVSEEKSTEHCSEVVSMTQPLFESSRTTKLAWLDSLVTLAAGVVILSFLLPSIRVAQDSARRGACASHLQGIGQALILFSGGNPEHRLPQIDVSGPLSFAGVYAIRLKDAGLLPFSRRLWCPAMECVDIDQPIPTVSVFLAASPTTQNNLRYTVGGNYAFTLGNVVDGIYVTPSMDSDNVFPVMGDSLWPIESDKDLGWIHGRNAANILFSDGRIQYVRVDRIDAQFVDNPYLNRARQQAAGFGLNDSCLGPSFRSPFVPVRFE